MTRVHVSADYDASPDTVWQALVHHPGVFKAGLCLYGVSNLFTLAADTHKFEARYLDSMIGPLPHIFHAIGLQAEPVTILADPATAMWGPIIANVWFGIPFFAITLLAARKSIPSELYEAAAIDGASPWQQFTKVTLPFLAPTIAITVMLRTVWIATFADLIYVMTAGGPAGSTNTIATYIYVTAFKSLDKGYASAIAVLLLVLLIAYALIVIQMRRALLRDV